LTAYYKEIVYDRSKYLKIRIKIKTKIAVFVNNLNDHIFIFESAK